MRTFDRDKTDPWFLSGKVVARLWGRDFSISVERYRDYLLELARAYKVDIAIKDLVDPPGVLVITYLGKEPPKLLDPLLVVNKESMPWLFCIVRDCENRLADGMPAGGTCAAHIGVH